MIEKYPEKGLAVVISRHKDDVLIRIGDFKGNVLNANDPNSEFAQLFKILGKYVMYKLVYTTKLMGVPQCIFYMSDTGVESDERLILVDFRLSINKFTGPGYISDIFTKQKIPSQKVVKVVQMTDEIANDIISGRNGYDGKYIIKPSAFKIMEKDGQLVPLYGSVP